MKKKGFRNYLGKVIFRTDFPAARAFDMGVLLLIIFSIIVVMLESVPSVSAQYRREFFILEWVITIMFTIEYVLRIWTVRKRKKYIWSFYGIVDLVSTLPAYIALFFTGSQAFAVIRALRLLRIFRILKMSRYVSESNMLWKSLWASRMKISVFLMAVMIIVVMVGSLMYIVEGVDSGFTSIPRSIYWAIVTITTVGYGDISPVTPLGQFLASILMLMGYAIIAVPTGIVTAEFSKNNQKKKKSEKK